MRHYKERRIRVIVCEYDNQKFLYETLEDTYDAAARKAVNMYVKETRNTVPDSIYEQRPSISL